ncbi:MAG: hypothetical protein ABS81_06040 [Pseudonocardia sp. SCN 72-86]|nr:MAG: hypothetical protein ABS81_06040 [Pseudonocardia sp. SCN 72-86]
MRRVVLATLAGSSLEWYDFFLYATASALVFNKVFFSAEDPAVGTLLAFGTFAVGFVARPIGSVIFGAIGDRFGRRPSLVGTLFLMGAATTAIGLVPSYATIGVAAPILLVVLRLLQGLGAGAELAGGVIVATEYAAPERRGLYASMTFVGVYVGTLLSSLVFALVVMLPEPALLSWGWRLPFLASFLLVAVGLYIRHRVPETPEFVALEKADDVSRAPLADTLVKQWRSVLKVIGVVAAAFVVTYTYQAYALSYIKTNLGITGSLGTVSVAIASVVAIGVAIATGAASDRFGRKPVLIVAATWAALWAFPFFWLVNTGSPIAIIVAMIGGVGLAGGACGAAQGPILAEMFNAQNRFTGFSVSREIGSILFSGLTPLIAAALVAAASGASWPVSLYVVGAALITLITGLIIRETAPRKTATRVPVLDGPAPAAAEQA